MDTFFDTGGQAAGNDLVACCQAGFHFHRIIGAQALFNHFLFYDAIRIYHIAEIAVLMGELCNFMLGAVFSALAGYLYKHHKSRKNAIIGAVAGAVAMALFSVPSNYFITYPAYVKFYHMPLEAILGMYQAILPSANSLIKCLVIFNMPFTLVKGLLDALICMLIYKPLSPILHGRK